MTEIGWRLLGIAIAALLILGTLSLFVPHALVLPYEPGT